MEINRYRLFGPFFVVEEIIDNSNEKKLHFIDERFNKVVLVSHHKAEFLNWFSSELNNRMFLCTEEFVEKDGKLYLRVTPSLDRKLGHHMHVKKAKS